MYTLLLRLRWRLRILNRWLGALTWLCPFNRRFCFRTRTTPRGRQLRLQNRLALSWHHRRHFVEVVDHIAAVDGAKRLERVGIDVLGNKANLAVRHDGESTGLPVVLGANERQNRVGFGHAANR